MRPGSGTKSRRGCDRTVIRTDSRGSGMAVRTAITVRVPLTIRRRPGRKTVVTLVRQRRGGLPTRADPALVKALARAFRYQRLLDEGRYASISEMAAAERIERGYLGSLLRLTLWRRISSRRSWTGGGRAILPCLCCWALCRACGMSSGPA